MKKLQVLGAFLLLVLLSVARTNGQDSEGPIFIPEEAKINIEGPGHFLSNFDVLVISAVLGSVPVPLILAMGFMSSHRYRVARAWAYGTLIVAGVHGVGAVFILWTLITSGRATWNGMGVDDYDFLCLGGMCAIGLYWSRWIIRTTRLREAAPKRFLAGTRVGLP